MRVSVATIVSERSYGVIVSAKVLEENHPYSARTVRVRMLDRQLLSRPLCGEVWDVQGDLKDSAWEPVARLLAYG